MQHEPPDEVILIDDGSTDRTLEIANSYKFQCPYKVISIDNAGQGNARNIGLQAATSNYVYFFDSDDLLVDRFIKSVKEQINLNNQPDIILFSGKSFNDPGYKGNRWIEYSRGFSANYTNRASFLDNALSKNALFCSPCLYISKRSIWLDKGLEFDSNFLEDEAIFYPLLFSCSSYSVSEDVFFLRRNREGSTMTMTPNERHLRGSLNCLQTSLKLLSIHNLTKRELFHIKKRIEMHCISYILMARKTGTKARISMIVSALLKTQSISLALKATAYLLRIDKSETISSIKRSIKRTAA